MPSYSAYGLTIESDLRFPELVAADPIVPDLVVRCSTVERPFQAPFSDRRAWAEDGTAYLFCRRRGALRISRGREVLVDASSSADECVVRNWVLGQGLGVAMFQRGFLVLHASVVKCGDTAIAFVGGSGAGKSTLAMAFCRSGDHILEDDHAVVAEGSIPTVMPGTPQVRLHEDTLRSLGISNAFVSCGRVSEEKLGWDARRHFGDTPVPLGQVFIISEGDEYRITPLSVKEGAAELVRHSFLSSLLVRAEHASGHEKRCAALASRIPVQRLCLPRSLDNLHQLVRLVRMPVEAAEACA